ncbi:MAG: VOC family protein [Deltaproteobacteria bacterium]|nr:VOC family protein [Deltaproteobacteria bacterium]
MITGFDHIHIICGNMEEAVQYFEKIFDGRVVSRGESRGFPLIRMDVHGAPVALLGTEPGAGQLIPGKGSRGLDHFGFKVKDIEQTAVDLKKRGAKFSIEPTVTPSGLKIAFIDGPEGTRIELVERE